MNPTQKVEAKPPVEDAWIAHMRRGEWEQAWRISDEALRSRGGAECWHWPRHLQYVWDGRPLKGKRVLVRCYHGLGDTVQFIRYIPLLGTIAREVIVWVQPKLIPLLRDMTGIDQLLPLHDGDPGVEYDADVELMELPHVFRSTLQTLPRTVPYLSAPRFTDRQGGAFVRRNGLRVGLVWRAGDWNEHRSISLMEVRPLFAVAGVHWVILQHEATDAELPAEKRELLGDHSVEVAAEAMTTLDLMITVDTLAAHLAGALAVPTWTLLHADPDWRWMRDRDDSPWYPTMRLFRQTKAGDWCGVIARVAGALREAVASGRKVSAG
jgi:hypothetical protein